MFIEQHESAIRLAVFVGGFVALATAETIFPRRARLLPRVRRWAVNLALVAVGAAALRLTMPLLAVGTAYVAAARGWGLLALVDAPTWLAWGLTLIALDCAVYVQHVAFHRIPLLWRLHRVHHADRDLDTSSGLRFHPGEILISMGWKMACVAALGAPPAAVIAYEVGLNAAAMFTHANLNLPGPVDRLMRAVFVTPDMHRIHHSTASDEMNSNYGNILSVWDRLFRVYRADPRAGHAAMAIGLAECQDARPSHLWWSLASPFRGAGGAQTRTLRPRAK